MDTSFSVSLLGSFGTRISEHGKPGNIISCKSRIRWTFPWYYMPTSTIGIKVVSKRILKHTLLLKSNGFFPILQNTVS